MKKDIKPFLFFSIIASLLVGHLANRTALIFEGLTGNLVENINAAIDAIIPALQNNPFMIGTSKTALISGAIGAACVWLIFLYNVFGAKNFMRGSEHGSARWGTAKDQEIKKTVEAAIRKANAMTQEAFAALDLSDTLNVVAE